MTKRGLASSVAVLVLLFAQAAGAQSQQQNTVGQGGPEWLKDRRYNEGSGIRAGDFELHPGIAGEVGYDSNFFQRTTQVGAVNGAPDAPVVPSAVIRVTPSLYLSTTSAQRRESDPEPPSVAFRAGVNATYRALFGLTSDASTVVGGAKPNDPAQEDALSGSADLHLDILPSHPVGASIFGAYTRTIQPNTVNADPNDSFNRDDILVGAELILQPGSGTLDWRAGYQFTDSLFEASAGVPFDNYSNQFYTRGRWRFRPRTALVYDGSIRFNTYQDIQSAYDAAGLLNSTPVRARIGINGLVTERFAVLAMAGWGASFIDTAALPAQQQYDSVIGQAELKWYLAASPGIAAPSELGLALSTVAIGYTRDFQTSYIGNYYGIDRGYLRFDYFFAGRALVTLNAGLAAISYPEILAPGGASRNAAFTDARADASLFGEYRFTDAFAINATLRYTQNFSNQEVLEVPVTTGARFGMAWQRYEAYLGLRLFL
jgi:hypothetical protein